MWLLHGTTRLRAERILRYGPDVTFVEPGGIDIAGNFSFSIEGERSAIGDARAYACGKGATFPNELGAAIVAADVPEEIVWLAAREHLSPFIEMGVIEYDEFRGDEEFVRLCGGVIQFDPGPALGQLMEQWASLAKEIRGVS